MSPPSKADAVVVGAGHNGLIAAIRLAEEGLRVVVVERAERPGGALRSAPEIDGSSIHDLFATNLGMLTQAPFVRERESVLSGHGYGVAHTDAAFASVFPGSGHLSVRQKSEGGGGLCNSSAADLLGWNELEGVYRRYAGLLGGALGSEFPSARSVMRLGRTWIEAGRPSLGGLGRLLTSSTREVGERYLSSEEAKTLLACWGMHLDYGPDDAGGAVMALLQAFGAQQGGIAVAKGGASTVVDALVGYLRELGGELRTGQEVVGVTLEGGAIDGVVLSASETIRCRRVIASVTPQRAVGLLPPGSLSLPIGKMAEEYLYGPASFMVHLVLRGPMPWSATEVGEFAYVHVAPSLATLAMTMAEARNGLLPREPMLCVGQTSVVDPTRSGNGNHVIWVQARCVPSVVRSDAAGELSDTSWDLLRDPFGQRILRQLEAHAPGMGERTIGKLFLAPSDLEQCNPNLVGGDPLTGSTSPSQMLGMRPFVGMSRYRTPVSGFYLTGAATWPGPGLNGVSGELAARAAIRDERGSTFFRRWRTGDSSS